MFISKRRPIVTPQSEHLKLVGTLAMLWGNDKFDSPPIERESMIAGMGTHDRGYGYLDNHPIGGMDESEWFPIARRTFNMPCTDVVADSIVKYHFRRLAGHDDSPGRKALTKEFSKAIDEHLEKHNLSKELFDRIDRITDLCDSLSFSLCFDMPASGEISIYPRNGQDTEIAVKYHVENGVISAQPWPFSVNSYQGYLLAYKSDGYPEMLDPVILSYELRKS
ncbi:MAG: hypothetical protein WBL25_15255 [Anaerolineales bacterium]